jgi:hypothetical protein
MTRREIAREIVIVAGTAGLSGTLFWMSVYLAGPIAIVPGAGVLFLALSWFARRMTTPQLVAERTVVACLLAAQASLLTAVILEVLPAFVHGVL